MKYSQTTVDAIKKHKKIFLEDCVDLDASLGVSWQEVCDLADFIEKNGEMLSDTCDEHGFETCIWKYNFDGTDIYSETTWGIGSFTIVYTG
jgi:hypothetical protein